MSAAASARPSTIPLRRSFVSAVKVVAALSVIVAIGSIAALAYQSVLTTMEVTATGLGRVLTMGDQLGLRLAIEEDNAADRRTRTIAWVGEVPIASVRETDPDLAELRSLGGRGLHLQLSSMRLIYVVDLATLVAEPGMYTDTRIFILYDIPAIPISAIIALAIFSIVLLITRTRSTLREHEAEYGRNLQFINQALSRIGRGQLEVVRGESDREPPEIGTLREGINQMVIALRAHIEGFRSFTDLAAHELRKPLARMSSQIKELLRNNSTDVDGAARGRAVGPLQDEVEALLGLYDSLFDLAQTRAELLDLSRFAPFDLAALVSDVLEDFTNTGDHRHRYDSDLPGPIVVRGEQPLVRRAVENLLENARKYAPEGATISVTARVADGAFSLAVMNTGSAFPEDIQAEAFRAWRRSRVTRHLPGLGLGLNLVAAVATKHGWTAALVPHPDKAEVRMTGPLAPPV